MMFVKFPFTVIVTWIVNVQSEDAARLPPLKENELSPGTASIAPLQFPTDGLAGLATIIPSGIVSANLIPFIGTLLGFTNSILSVEAEPPKTVSGSNPLTK